MSFQVSEDGLKFDHPNVRIQFGSTASFERISSPVKKPLCLVKQVHGDLCHYRQDWSDEMIEGDAHWTDQRQLELGVVTADCLPILGYHENDQRVFAIHAGWRGLAADIIAKSIGQISSDIEEWKVWIGPHIQMTSYETELPIARKIMEDTLGQVDEANFQVTRPGYCLFNMRRIAEQQLLKVGLVPTNIQSLLDDTFTDFRFYSYRRQKDKAGRQLSSIILK